MLSVTEAFQHIVATLPAAPVVSVPIEQAAGEILREAVAAERDQPPFDRVTMDGIALRHAEWDAGRRCFTSRGVQAAGAPALALEGEGNCIEVMTGAPLPAGADSIVPVERLERDGPCLTIDSEAAVTAGEFVHRRGSDYREGAVLLQPGARLGPTEMAVVASCGLATVRVARRPRIALLPTGDELVPPGRPVAPHQIRRSNDFALAAALAARGHRAVAVEALRDDPALLREAISRHLDGCDVLVLSGGVSMGQFDHLPRIMDELGVETVFHRIRQKPGRPMWYGLQRQRGTAVFALPGNPVSSLVCLVRFVLPALDHALGAAPPVREHVRLAEGVTFRPALTWHLPVHVESTQDGGTIARPKPTNTSGDFASLAGTTGFVELPADETDFPEGYVAPLSRW
jgi:molybdopterin molybdotransferase